MMEVNEITPIKINLPKEENNIKLYVLSDTHLGDSCADLDQIKEVINFIHDTPNCYCILLGDLLNTALKDSKSDIYCETLNVSQAQKLALDLLLPIKDKIIAMTPGNHENRVWRSVGVDVSLWLAEKLGVQKNYRNNFLALDIAFGKDNSGRPYHLRVVGQHGAYGGGRRLGAAMNALEDIDGIVGNADIIIRAHTHQSVQGSRSIFLFNEKGNLEKRTKYYFNAPAFLKTGGYGLDKGYRPTDTSPCYLNVRAYNRRSGSRLEKTFKIDKITL